MSREAAGTDPYALACDVGAVITSSLVLEDVLAAVARHIAEAVGVWECDLYEYYSESRTIVASAVWAQELTEADLAWIGTTASLDERPSYEPVFLRGETTESYVDDEASADEKDRALMEQWGELSTLSVPLVFEGQVIGCLTLVEKREVRRFDAGDKQLVSLLAIPAAVAIHNARMYRWEEQQNRHLSSLLDSSRALTSAVTPDEILNLVCREAAMALDVTDCVIYEYDPELDAIIYRALYARSEDHDDAHDLGTIYPLSEYPSDRQILRSGEVAELSASDAGLPDDVRHSMTKWGEKTCLTVPLAFNDEALGLLVIIETLRERRFSEEEIDLARGLGEQAAMAIRHGQLYRRQEAHNKRLLALLETSRVLAASLDAGQVLAEMRSEAAGLFGVAREAVGVHVQADGEYLPLEQALARLDDEDEAGDGDVVDAGVELDELRRRALEVRSPAQETAQSGSRLVVPLLVKDESEGFVEVSAEGARHFSETEVDLLQMLAGQAAAAVVNTRLYKTVERQAVTDGLTGLYNHRYFYERLEQEFLRARRYGLPLSLLMLDLDDFKRFNDRCGHQVGDKVLVEAARVLASQLRRNIDFAARYGGEEFVVLLPNTSRDGAEVVGRRLVQQVAALDAGPELPPPHADGARTVGERIRQGIAEVNVPAQETSKSMHVTVSVGLAAFPGSATSGDQLVRDADKALYLAKRRGKNRLEVFGA